MRFEDDYDPTYGQYLTAPYGRWWAPVQDMFMAVYNRDGGPLVLW